MKKAKSSWWRHFPGPGCPQQELQLHSEPHQTPAFARGDIVRLVGKPDKPRKVIDVSWHAHCHQYVYVVETSHHAFCAYWYADQLMSEERWQRLKQI